MRNGFLRGRSRGVAVLAALALSGGAAYAGLARSGHAGPQGDGTSITPTGWRITPAGTQVVTGERPFGMALSPDGGTVLLSNNGVGMQSLQAIDASTGAVRQTIDYPAPQALFIGVVYSPDGRHAYASAGANDVVRRYTVAADGSLSEGAPIQLATTDASGNPLHPFPAGLAISADGKTLYVVDHYDNTLSIIDLPGGAETRVPLSDQTCVVGAWGDPSLGTACRFAHGVTLSHDGSKAYVSNWGQSSVDVVDTASRAMVGEIAVGTHPSALSLNPANDDLYVANGESDSVSVIDTATDTVRASINLSPYQHAPVGTDPNALTVGPDGKRLYVANAGNNDVSVIRLGGPLGGTVLGQIPTAWWPAALAIDATGKHLYAAGAKGLGAGPNSEGQYIGSMINGQLSIVDTPTPAELGAYTKQVKDNAGFAGGQSVRSVPGAHQHVVPNQVGGVSPIKHVIYIVNENRTYDQVLGDLGRGNGDPSLTLFGESVAPNHRQLARQFTTLDNLYAAGEVSQDGWDWSTAAYANSFNEHSWATGYGGRGHFYTSENGGLADSPGRNAKRSYIWDHLDQAGLSYRNYGFWATDVPPVAVYNEPNLDRHTDHAYAGFNMSIPDQARFAEWQREFRAYVRNDDLPSVEFLKFPRDHTSGTSPGAPTPQAMVADSDWALGKLVDEVSHSRYWKDTAIFVIEDDAQDGPDHVDAHRTLAHVISPYTQLGKVDSTFYSTVSMLRTMELILGLRPMTQFDAAALPMAGSFTDTPDYAPYAAIRPDQPLDELNPANAPLAAASAKMNFHREDRAPEQLLNRAIWESVKGANSPMPTPGYSLAGSLAASIAHPDD